MNELQPKRDRVQEIFDAQRVLMDHFYPIERQTTGLELEIPADLQTHRGQAWVRECVGRLSEEIVEILDASDEHRNEEIADALCFLFEIFHIIGVTRPEFAPNSEFPADDSLTRLYRRANDDRIAKRLSVGWRDLLIALWGWTHELKAKPWKPHPAPTNVSAFKANARSLFFLFIRICYSEGVPADALWGAYFRKHRINLERIAAT